MGGPARRCNKVIIDTVDVVIITYQEDSHVLRQASGYAARSGKVVCPFGVIIDPERGMLPNDDDLLDPL